MFVSDSIHCTLSSLLFYAFFSSYLYSSHLPSPSHLMCRVYAECTSSNGSSSMASACGYAHDDTVSCVALCYSAFAELLSFFLFYRRMNFSLLSFLYTTPLCCLHSTVLHQSYSPPPKDSPPLPSPPLLPTHNYNTPTPTPIHIQCNASHVGCGSSFEEPCGRSLHRTSDLQLAGTSIPSKRQQSQPGEIE